MHTNGCIFIEISIEISCIKFWLAINESCVTLGEFHFKMFDSICMQNGQTLQSLNLSFCNGLDLESVKQILQKCVKLKEVNFGDTRLSDATESYLAENLPSQIERLDLIGDSELSEPAEGFFEIKCNQIQMFDDHVVDCGH